MLNRRGHRWSLVKLLVNMNMDKIILFYTSKKTMWLNIIDARVKSISYACCKAQNRTGEGLLAWRPLINHKSS